MPVDTEKLDYRELFHLAVEAANRDDHAAAITFLKDAQAREQPSEDYARTTYFLGAEYAQIGMYERAVEAMAQAVRMHSDLHIASFQLGLLHLTSGRVVEAREAWSPLAALDRSDPNFALRQFKEGLEALAEDRFAECRVSLLEGMQNNQQNAPLNADMQRVLDALPPVGMSGSAESEASGDQSITESATEQHLFLSAYRKPEN